VKVAAIVNRNAAAGAARRRWPDVMRQLERRLGPVRILATRAPGHATELARRLAAGGYEVVIAAGGDGTLNEVANGILAEPSAVRIGLLPLARGGDFARTLGLNGLQHAIDTLGAGLTCPVDAVQASFGTTRRYFVNMASVGLGAEAARNARHWDRLLPPAARYLAAAVAKLAGGYGFDVRLRLDDAPAVRFQAATIALANGRFQGGGLLMAPRAAFDDGLIDVTLVERTGLLEVAANLNLLYSGKLYSHPKVRHWRARRIRVEADAEAPIELDGEALGATPFEATVIPGALKIICPA
jgi:diacylglycerol kinase (ATP)